MKLGLLFWKRRAAAHVAMAHADFKWAEKAYAAGLVNIARANWKNGMENVRRAADCEEQAALWRDAA